MFHGACFAVYKCVDREVPGPDKGLRIFLVCRPQEVVQLGTKLCENQQCGQNKPLFLAASSRY